MRLPFGRDLYERWVNQILVNEDVFNQKTNRDIHVRGRDLFIYSPDGSRWRLVVGNDGAFGLELAAVTPSTASLVFTGGAAVVVGATVVPSTASLSLTGGAPYVDATRFWGWDGVLPAYNQTQHIAIAGSYVARAAGGEFAPTSLTSDFYKITTITINWDTVSGNVRVALYSNTAFANGMDSATLLYDHGEITPTSGRQTYNVASDTFIAHGDYLFVAIKSSDPTVLLRGYSAGPVLDIDGRSTNMVEVDETVAWSSPSPVTWSNPNNDTNSLAVGVEYVVTDLARPGSGALTLTGGTPSVT